MPVQNEARREMRRPARRAAPPLRKKLVIDMCVPVPVLVHDFTLISRLADALIVMDSRLVIRVENMVTTSSLEVLGVDLNGTMSKYLRLSLLVLLVLE